MTIGARLREERERLGLSQEAFAALGHASKRSQLDWEKGVATPNAAFLAALAAQGLDVRYVVTGQRPEAELAPDEQRLVALFRLALPGLRKGVLSALAEGELPAPRSSITVKGSVGQQVQGNVEMRDLVVAAPPPPAYKVARKRKA